MLLAPGDKTAQQKSVAVYLIDRLALRVGGEKDTGEEADTVGCCSLRVEHVKLDVEEPRIQEVGPLEQDLERPSDEEWVRSTWQGARGEGQAS